MCSSLPSSQHCMPVRHKQNSVERRKKPRPRSRHRRCWGDRAVESHGAAQARGCENCNEASDQGRWLGKGQWVVKREHRSDYFILETMWSVFPQMNSVNPYNSSRTQGRVWWGFRENGPPAWSSVSPQHSWELDPLLLATLLTSSSPAQPGWLMGPFSSHQASEWCGCSTLGGDKGLACWWLLH